MEMQFRLLGPIEIAFDDDVISPGSERQRALLAMLLLDANRHVSSQRLTEMLWSDPPHSAAGNLRTYASGLRLLLDGRRLGAARRISTRRGVGYRVDVRPGELDTSRFQHWMASAADALRRRDSGAAVASLQAALGSWRGCAGSDLGPLGHAGSVRIAALNDQRLSVCEALAEAHIALHHSTEAIKILSDLAAENPVRDHAWATLMRARYQAGDVRGALETYRQARHIYNELLGIGPPQELADLQGAILTRQDHLLVPIQATLR